MTEQDKTEIRQIIREELAALKVPTMVFAAAACNHEWHVNLMETVPTMRCKKCGQLPSADMNKSIFQPHINQND